MTDVLERRSLTQYGGSPLNYLNDWARREGHLEDFGQYTVLVEADATTGEQFGSIVEKVTEEAAEEPPVRHHRGRK